MTKGRKASAKDTPPPQRVCAVCSVAPASLMCSCTTPALLLCIPCSAVHQNTADEHCCTTLPAELPKVKEEANCPMCELVPPTITCCCQFPPFAVCRSCLTAHLSQPPLALHIPLPYEIRQFVTSRDYIETLRKRQLGKEQAKQTLMANLSMVDEAEQAIKTRCISLIATIKEEMDEAIQNLWKIKEDLIYAIKTNMKEIEDHIYDENYKPSNSLASAIWNFSFLPAESEFTLFSYSVHSESILKAVKEMIQFRVNMQEQHIVPGYLSIINSTSIRKFYFNPRMMTPPLTLSTAVKIDMTSAWLFLEDGKVFSCGRHYPSSQSAYMIDPNTGEVSPLEDMLTTRCQQGMLCYRQCVYVFGGLASTYLRACESYSVLEGKWRALPEMIEARDCFNPCVQNEAVYIAGGGNTAGVEVFSLKAETFSQLFVSLPKADCSLALIDGDDLVVIQREALYRWKLNSAEDRFREGTLVGSGAWSNSPPLVLGRSVYVLNCWTNSIGKYDLDLLAYEKAAFTY